MSVVFHTAVSLALGCIAAAQLRGRSRLGQGAVLGAAFALSVLSHGALDGLKHLYPVRPPELDVALSLAAFCAWTAVVRGWLRLVFALTFFGCILPDLVDLGPLALNRVLGWGLPLRDRNLFPWHWPEGSGSLYDGKLPMVSLTNHVIVASFSAAAILAHARGLFVWSRAADNR